MKDLKNTHSFVNDLWQLIKKYYFPDPAPDSAYWQNLIAEAGELGRKYGVKIEDGRITEGLLEANLINAFVAYADREEFHGRRREGA